MEYDAFVHYHFDTQQNNFFSPVLLEKFTAW
jgi:hypothetical protein